MTPGDIVKILRRKGCVSRKGKGAHQVWQCGNCRAVLSMHRGDIPKGTLHAIFGQLEPCLGPSWWQDG
jgi:predicted RNA binding protein YcfA (HicA-like mRNA interferase family)